MKILILGSTGRLGRALCSQFPDAVKLVRRDHDAEHPGISTLLRDTCPDLILNAVAMCGVEPCEADPAKAFRINAAFPIEIAEYAQRSGCQFIHFSTDYVFDGNKSPYVESDQASPLGAYGWTKFVGEQVLIVCPSAIVLRIGSLIGDDKAGIADVLNQVDRGFGTPEAPVNVLRQFCSPITTWSVAKIIGQIVERRGGKSWGGGRYHIGAREAMWKRDIASLLLMLVLGHDRTRIVDNQLPRRPLFSAFDSTMFAGAFRIEMPNLRNEILAVARLHAKAAVQWPEDMVLQ